MENDPADKDLTAKAQKALEDVKEIGSRATVAFPYEDVRRLVGRSEEYDDFSSDLNLYLMDIFGFASWGKKALRWNSEKLDLVETCLLKDFFSIYPRYSHLKELITHQEFPELFQCFQQSEELRTRLLSLIKHLRVRSKLPH